MQRGRQEADARHSATPRTITPSRVDRNVPRARRGAHHRNIQNGNRGANARCRFWGTAPLTSHSADSRRRLDTTNMLNLSGQDDESAATSSGARTPAHPAMTEQQRQRLSRRRARSGERIHGWADVRKLPKDKYHVDLNMTAHLNWDDWERMCEEEPMETQEATWCVLSEGEEGQGDSADEDGSQAQRQREQAAQRNPRNDLRRNETSGVPTSARFIRRRSPSPVHAEAAPTSPTQSRGG